MQPQSNQIVIQGMEDPKIFNVGDRVVVTGGKRAGLSGTVSFILPYTINQCGTVAVRSDTSEEFVCRIDDLDHQPEERPKKPTTKKCAVCNEARLILQTWLDKSGHDKCHYYPDLFNALVKLFGLESKQPIDISREEFEQGCLNYQDELFGPKRDQEKDQQD